ncbi:hypothetical protein K2173_003353 [Erythroxylum novogranatense]|uniref:Pentatricopeptide repeat-containing protein n=1 Tax=Erythroxylum novogranatense TaxID=1862640 RepID=A0AAV8S8T0_9ROSI|nr:hypothetical protein K2173_003353 [Erythroxylum novogranatense]
MRILSTHLYQVLTRLAKPINSISDVRFLATASQMTALPESYVVKPPIKPWPQRLFPKRLVFMINKQQNLDLALQIFEYAGKYHPGFSHNYETYCSIISKLSRARAFEPMESLLCQLHESQLKCGENLFIDVIRNYGLSGKPFLALKTFVRIEEFKVKRSVRSLNTLLNTLVQNKRYHLVHAMFRDCRTKYGIVPNVFTYNILIKGLCEKRDLKAAVKVLDEMPSMGLIPNVVTYTTILGGYVSLGDMVNAEKVFGELFDRGWLPDATTFAILMDGYCKQGTLNDAIKVMDNMEEYSVEPNDVTYGVMIEAYCKAKKSGEACNLLDDMLDKNYIPNSALCCKVIDVLCEQDKVDDACDLWKRMLKKNCMPDNAITSTLIHWLCKEGKAWEARKLFDEFEHGSIPSLLTYNTLIAGMCEQGELNEVGKLWDDMVEKGCTPNAFTYNVLIKGFSNVGKAKEGIRILEEMLETGCSPNRLTYSVLIEGLQESEIKGEVDKIVSMAITRGGVCGSWDLFLSKVVCNLDRGMRTLDKLLKENAA